MLKKIFAVGLLGATAIFCANASAQNYLGVEIGQAKSGDTCIANANDCVIKNANAVEFQINAGTKFSEHWALEVSYFNTAAFTKIIDGRIPYEYSHTGLDATVVYAYPFGASNFSGIAKFGVGYNRANVRTEYSLTGQKDPSGSFQEKNNSIQPVFAFGVEYKLAEDLSGRVLFSQRRADTNAYISKRIISSALFGLVKTF